jgi:hypothetical protein
VLASQNAAHPAVEAAYAAVALAEDARMDADFNDQTTKPLMNDLIANRLISAQNKATLQALSQVKPSINAANVSHTIRRP